MPLASRAGKALRRPSASAKAAQSGESGSDAPIGNKLANEKAKIEQKAEKEAKAIRGSTAAGTSKKKAPAKAAKSAQDSKAATAKTTTNGKRKQANGVKKKEESSDDDIPLSRKVPAAAKAAKGQKAVKSESSTPSKKMNKASTEEPDEGEEEEEEYRWWEDPMQGDGTIKWKTLEHNGVVFPPSYEPLPKNVKMKYDGVPITLEPEAEEVAGFFGSMLNSTHNVENPTFKQNFFLDFTAVVKKTGGAKDPKGNLVAIKEFSKCDFNPMFEYYDKRREEKRALPPAEKKKLKAEKDAAEAPYTHCMWDGRKQKIGNFRVEPPDLFRGRGEHPKTGMVKQRVQPEQITINIGKDAPVPPPPEGHRWKEVKHDQEGTWLAMWRENINGNYKYVMLAANSDIKGQSDFKKFEKARELKVCISRLLLLMCIC